MKLIRFHRVHGSPLHIATDPAENIIWLGNPPIDVAAEPSIKLRACGPLDEQRIEGDTFHVDGQGIAAIVGHLALMSPRASGLTLHRNVFRLFDGDAHLIELYRSTLRVMFGVWPGVGESGLWGQRVQEDVARATLADELTGNAAAVH